MWSSSAAAELPIKLPMGTLMLSAHSSIKCASKPPVACVPSTSLGAAFLWMSSTKVRTAARYSFECCDAGSVLNLGRSLTMATGKGNVNASYPEKKLLNCASMCEVPLFDLWYMCHIIICICVTSSYVCVRGTIFDLSISRSTFWM